MDNLKFAQKRELCALTLFTYFYDFQNCTSLLCSQWFAEREKGGFPPWRNFYVSGRALNLRA